MLCSSAARTRETLKRIAPALGGAEIRIEDELYAASGRALAARLTLLDARVGTAMLIAHNPGIENLALSLAAEGAGDPPQADLGRMERKFPTAGLATLAFEGEWRGLAPGGARLVEFVRPRDLG